MQVTNTDKKAEVVKSWTKRSSRCFQFDATQFLSSSGSVRRWFCTALFPAWSTTTPWNSCYRARQPYPWSSRMWSAATNDLVGRHCKSTHISWNDPSSKDHPHDECIWEGNPPPPTDTTTTGNLLLEVLTCSTASTTCHHHCLPVPRDTARNHTMMRWIYFSSEINYMYPTE